MVSLYVSDRSVLINVPTALAVYEGSWSDSVDFSNVISSPKECAIAAFGTVRTKQKEAKNYLQIHPESR